MAKRPSATDFRTGAKPNRSATPLTTGTPSRIDRLVEVIDLCTAAKETADAVGEKLLSYLLSMAIQESRTAMRGAPPIRN